MPDNIIQTIPKGRNEEVRIAISEFEGHQMIGVRAWYKNDHGEMRPGRNGISVKLELLPDLASALAEAERVARERGLIREAA